MSSRLQAGQEIAESRLSGTVIDGDDAPIRGALVTIRSADGSHAVTQVTDDEGSVSFAALPAGSYQVSARRPGYLVAWFGSTRPGGRGTTLAIRQGEHRDFSLRLFRGGVVTGQVFDPSGAPAPRQPVSILKRSLERGMSRLTATRGRAAHYGFNGPMTDDRGVYRVYELPPGEYLVAVGTSASPGNFSVQQTTPEAVQRALHLLQHPSAPYDGPEGTGQRPSATFGMVPTYHPGTPIPSLARRLQLSAGQELSGIDVVLQYTRTHAIDGTVQILSSEIASQSVLVQLVSLDSPVGARNHASSTAISQEGRFRFSGLPPDSYRVEARTIGRAGSDAVPPTLHWGSTRILLNGQDAQLSLTLAPTPSIRGRVMHASAQNPSGLPLRLTLIPQPVVNGSWMSARSAAVTAGRFELADVVPGRYRLILDSTTGNSSERPLMLAKATVDGQDVLDQEFEILPGARTVESVITLSTAETELSGMVDDPSGQTPSRYMVALFSANPSLWFWRSPHVGTMDVSATGAFRFRGFRPGRYYLALLTDVDPDAVYSATFLNTLVPQSISLHLVDGVPTLQNVRVAR
jgi:hypothetical protein